MVVIAGPDQTLHVLRLGQDVDPSRLWQLAGTRPGMAER
jgi:hypothetical protein